MTTEYLDPHFIRALCRDPERRTLQVSELFFFHCIIMYGICYIRIIQSIQQQTYKVIKGESEFGYTMNIVRIHMYKGKYTYVMMVYACILYPAYLL